MYENLMLKGRLLKVAHSSKGAWHLAATASRHTALRNEALRRHGFLLPSDLAVTMSQSDSVQLPDARNARPVLWEGAGAQSPAPDPISTAP